MTYYLRELSPPINYQKDTDGLNTADRIYNL
jgi:hypothetical protein